ncbi:hypothetical protein [Dyella silvatica]|uniref:hypothetical protein n=1 Tax=Dyella silvatica TaxID=2992128 RepID=UPI00224D4610|nr:hypothetical protein [Dyella silvatica]
MKTFFWLVKREYWENRGGFLWAPIITGGIFLLLNIMGIIAAEVIGARHGVLANGNLNSLVAHANAGDMADVGNALDVALLSSMWLISIVMGFVVLFYCLGSLYDDRRDRSILFWKSLPISNISTVLSKVVSATVVAPVIAVIAGIVFGMLQLLIFTLVLSFHGINAWQLLLLAHPVRAVLSSLCSIPLYALFALPAVGWLMFCSAWARSKPFLWAVATPALTGLMLSWFGIMDLFNLSTSWFWSHVVLRVLISVFPGSNLALDDHNMTTYISISSRGQSPLSLIDPAQTYSELSSPNLWIGVIAGIALLAVVTWLRRTSDDS